MKYWQHLNPVFHFPSHSIFFSKIKSGWTTHQRRRAPSPSPYAVLVFSTTSPGSGQSRRLLLPEVQRKKLCDPLEDPSPHCQTATPFSPAYCGQPEPRLCEICRKFKRLRAHDYLRQAQTLSLHVTTNQADRSTAWED